MVLFLISEGGAINGCFLLRDNFIDLTILATVIAKARDRKTL